MRRKFKHGTWADPTKEWDGFLPVRYGIEGQAAAALKVTKHTSTPAGDQTSEITVFDVIRALPEGEVSKVDKGPGVITLVVSDNKVQFTGLGFALDVLYALLDFKTRGFDLSKAGWYWYDFDSLEIEPQDSYSFFAVCGDQIANERVSFGDYHGNGFDPDVFERSLSKDVLWGRERSFEEADAAFWYRKFYTETRTGQLMVYTPDAPLHYYSEGRWNPLSAFMAVERRLASLQTLLGWLLLFVGIGLLLVLVRHFL